MIFKAIELATKAHNQQFRKGTRIPYIVHPLNVMKTVINFWADTETAIAAVLHDTLEDTNLQPEKIEKIFGKQVLELVKKVSEKAKLEDDLPKDWKSRKIATVKHLSEETDERVLMIACADKLDNLTDTLNDFKTYGNQVWARFNAGVDDQIWYFASLADIFSSKLPSVNKNLQKLFKIYINKTQELLKNIKL